MMVHYAGIGSRKTPKLNLELMEYIGYQMAGCGYVLRSGAADGADSAFESGCDDAGGDKEIWLPWAGFNGHENTGLYPTPGHIERAITLHPCWHRLSQGPRLLHARNAGQILGTDLKTPVSFVVCWTPDGCVDQSTRTQSTGGTGTAIVLAANLGIPVFNLQRSEAISEFSQFLRTL